MSSAERRKHIRDFLARHFRQRELGDDEDYFALGFVNSLFAMQLISFVERQFEIQVLDDDLDLDNFRTVTHLDRFLARKLGSQPAPTSERSLE